MRKYVVSKLLNFIKQYQSFDGEKEEILIYGLENLYITITKTVGILTIAYLFGIFKESLLFTIIYNLIRTPSFGLHAKESWMCWISSSIIFIGIPYIAKCVTINVIIRFIIGIITVLYINRYAPADTYKRPIVNPKLRRKYKIISTITAIAMVTTSLIINNAFLQNSFIFALIVQSFVISPQVYKLFKLPYDNYKNYQMAETN